MKHELFSSPLAKLPQIFVNSNKQDLLLFFNTGDYYKVHILKNKNSFLHIVLHTSKHHHKHHLKTLIYVFYCTSLSSAHLENPFCHYHKLYMHQ